MLTHWVRDRHRGPRFPLEFVVKRLTSETADFFGFHDRGRLMTALDSLNHRYGRGTVLMASAGLAGDHRTWAMRQERRTPGYTTCWADMPVARA